MASNIKHYSITIQWSEEDQVYIATVPELPGCKTHGETYEEALKQAKYAIEGWIEFAKELGRPIPQPRVLQMSA
jgi:predicted RNase H-like HicB family nuclease